MASVFILFGVQWMFHNISYIFNLSLKWSSSSYLLLDDLLLILSSLLLFILNLNNKVINTEDICLDQDVNI